MLNVKKIMFLKYLFSAFIKINCNIQLTLEHELRGTSSSGQWPYVFILRPCLPESASHHPTPAIRQRIKLNFAIHMQKGDTAVSPEPALKHVLARQGVLPLNINILNTNSWLIVIVCIYEFFNYFYIYDAVHTLR